MPRFYFPTRNGDTVLPDPVELEMQTPDGAAAEAVRALAHMGQDFQLRPGQQALTISVLNEAQETIFEAHLSLEAKWVGAPKRSL